MHAFTSCLLLHDTFCVFPFACDIPAYNLRFSYSFAMPFNSRMVGGIAPFRLSHTETLSVLTIRFFSGPLTVPLSVGSIMSPKKANSFSKTIKPSGLIKTLERSSYVIA